MSHILFDGDIQRYPALRSLFWQWGFTVGRLPASVQAGGRATVEDCDAIVHVAELSDPAGYDSGAMPDGAEAEGEAAVEAAPLLVIGAGPVAVESWITIPDPGPGGSRLKVALQSCQERARMLRGDPRSRHELDQFRNFLGHELRSPLTAIKTALTVMEAEGGHESGSHRMLRIAQRNLVRLAETVEWSQELMSLAEAPPAADLSPVSLASLSKAIPDHFDVHLDEKHGSHVVLTDPRLLGVLAGQMARVLGFVCPGSCLSFRLDFDDRSGDCRMSCTAGGDINPENAEGNRVEHGHLVRMLISPHLLQVLGARPRLFVEDTGTVELTIDLPLYAGTFSLAHDPVCPV
ncbi:MAG: hypothetical protein KAH56_02270 [Candidatus Krumholzibacteria bacterium]|nr:hypothetical protein [Candidatus Krumholzibacteria bacterium]